MAFVPEALYNLIKKSGISHKENSISFIFTCPKCNKKDKFYIRKRDGRFICFSCATTINFHGKAEYGLQYLLERSIKEIQQDLYDDIEQKSTSFININVKDFDDQEIEEIENPLQPFTYPVDFYPLDHEFSEKGRNYLINRGLNIDFCKEYDIRYCPQDRRVVFPVKSDEIIYGWQKRTILDNPNIPKMLSSPNLPKNRSLMFIDRLKGLDHAILCEGPVDALRCHLIGGGNICTMGKQVADGQIQLLINNGIKKLYLALDPDAYMEMDEICKKWRHVFEIYNMKATKKDIGEMEYKEVLDLFKSAPKVDSHYIFTYFNGE